MFYLIQFKTKNQELAKFFKYGKIFNVIIMPKKAFTIIELIVIVAILAILTLFIVASVQKSISAANDAVRKHDIANIYTSILSKKTLNGIDFPSVTSSIKAGETNADLQAFIDQYLETTPYDPNPEKAYLYTSNGADFSVAAILDNGFCFIKSTGPNLFGDENVCTAYLTGGIGLVQNFSVLHGSSFIDLVWAIPTALTSTPTANVSSTIVCINSPTEIDASNLPSETEMMTSGTIVAIVNNAYCQYRITLDNPDYYYCKTYSYDNTVVTNPGTVGYYPNTNYSSGGFYVSSSSYSSNYSSAAPSTYTPSAASYPPSIGGGTSSGGSTSPSFTTTTAANPDNTGSITLTWNPAASSTHTIIRRLSNIPPANNHPQSLADGVLVYSERNDKDGQDPTALHSYTDAGLANDLTYCYSAWAYDELTNQYSTGFVMACGGIPATDPKNLIITSTYSSFNLTWTKGSGTNTVIRRQTNTPPQNQDQGAIVYNNTASSFADNDPNLEPNTTYCYSLWSYNPDTTSLSTGYISGCGILADVSSPTNLTFPTIAYNSIILNWTKGQGAEKTFIVRKQGSVPESIEDGTEIYFDTGTSFIDTGLTDDTGYCYALYSVDEYLEYSTPTTGCVTTAEIIDGVCGTAEQNFYATTTNYGSATFCAQGTVVPSSPAFPEEGGSVSWQCVGTGPGITVDCAASRSQTSCVSGSGLTCVETVADGDYAVDKYTASVGTVSGTSTWVAPAGVTEIEYLVVAGGAGGGGNRGGGGGAGGFRTGFLTVVPGNSYTVTVGRGGAGGVNNTYGQNGANSVFDTIASVGGGGGAYNQISAPAHNGAAGGSGGGGARGGIGGAGTSGQGNNGGSGDNGSGGGAGAVGVGNGPGGAGLESSITGTPTYYAGGGAPRSLTTTQILGGIGGGGPGAYGTQTNSINPATGGVDGLGGGGGGGRDYQTSGNQIGGRGGSGVVIVRFLMP